MKDAKKYSATGRPTSLWKGHCVSQHGEQWLLHGAVCLEFPSAPKGYRTSHVWASDDFNPDSACPPLTALVTHKRSEISRFTGEKHYIKSHFMKLFLFNKSTAHDWDLYKMLACFIFTVFMKYTFILMAEPFNYFHMLC